MKRRKIIKIILFIFLSGCSSCGEVYLTGDLSTHEEGLDRMEGEGFFDGIEELKETEQIPFCGNGIVDSGEECDTLIPQSCTTTCNSTGSRFCENCRWSNCRVPQESCNGVDDNCNGIVDDVSGSPFCGDSCCNGGENSCTCPGDCGLPPPPSAPSPLSPHNGQRLETRRPLFRWFSSTGECGEPEYSIQVDDSCTIPGFSSCDFSSPEIYESDLHETFYSSSFDLPVRTSPPVGKRYYWRVRACYGESCCPWSEIWYIDVGMVENDFNGDGFSDFAVGNPEGAYNDKFGNVFLYYGGINGLESYYPSTVLVNPLGNDLRSASHKFGKNPVSSDINADGYSDLVVGAINSPWLKKVYIYLGGIMGLSSDNFIALEVPYGRIASSFGDGLSAGGDLNLDGFSDLVVGDPSYDGTYTDEGAVFVYYGNSSGVENTPSLIIQNPFPEMDDWFGSKVETVRDADADGYAEVIIRGEKILEKGRLYIYRGSSTGVEIAPSTIINNPFSNPLENSFWGWDFKSVGDVNGDGFDDFLVGYPLYEVNMGQKAYLFWGSKTVPLEESYTLIYLPAEYNFWGFGGIVGSLCDFNLDGYNDIFLHGIDSQNISYLLIYSGTSDGVSEAPSLILQCPELDMENHGGEFGASEGNGCIGDVNRDGNYDIAFGASELPTENTNHRGKVFVYYGDGNSISSNPSLTLINPFPTPLPFAETGEFGTSIVNW